MEPLISSLKVHIVHQLKGNTTSPRACITHAQTRTHAWSQWVLELDIDTSKAELVAVRFDLDDLRLDQSTSLQRARQFQQGTIYASLLRCYQRRPRTIAAC